MYRWIMVMGLMTVSTFSFAGSSKYSHFPYPPLNRIHFQLSAEQWVTTKTALVTIGVDASLNQKGMDDMQQQVNDSLQTLATGVTWQMTDYERNEDASGLERVHIEEQARLTSDQLTNIRTKTDTLSKPGIKYSVSDIQFTPSLADIQASQDALRAKLYMQIKQEMDLLDKTYDQEFHVHNLQFYSGDTPPMPVPAQGNGAQYKMLVAAPQPAAATMSQRLVMNVDVTLAAMMK